MSVHSFSGRGKCPPLFSSGRGKYPTPRFREGQMSGGKCPFPTGHSTCKYDPQMAVFNINRLQIYCCMYKIEWK